MFGILLRPLWIWAVYVTVNKATSGTIYSESQGHGDTFGAINSCHSILLSYEHRFISSAKHHTRDLQSAENG